MNNPTTGGSYRRETDGRLTRLDVPADAKTEQPAEQSADTETPLSEDATGKKGKA